MIWCVPVLIMVLFLPATAWSTTERSNTGMAASDIGAFNSALALYQVDVRGFPDTLAQLIGDNARGWAGPYMATISNDPWGFPYNYAKIGDSDYSIGLSHTHESGHDANYRLSRGTMVQMTERQRTWAKHCGG